MTNFAALIVSTDSQYTVYLTCKSNSQTTQQYFLEMHTFLNCMYTMFCPKTLSRVYRAGGERTPLDILKSRWNRSYIDWKSLVNWSAELIWSINRKICSGRRGRYFSNRKTSVCPRTLCPINYEFPSCDNANLCYYLVNTFFCCQCRDMKEICKNENIQNFCCVRLSSTRISKQRENCQM